MKHIMISIRPEWIEKILNGEKTLEIRKSFPKEECIVELYCTKSPLRTGKYVYVNEKRVREKYGVADHWCDYKQDFIIINEGVPSLAFKTYLTKGKVVARWHQRKCDKIEICDPDILLNGKQKSPDYFKKFACLTCEQLMEYIGCGQDNGWAKEWDAGYAWHIDNLEIYEKPKELTDFGLKRPFQSWGYLKDEI